MRLAQICKQDAFAYTNTSCDGLADRPRAYDDDYDGATHIETYWVPEHVDAAIAKLTAFYARTL